MEEAIVGLSESVVRALDQIPSRAEEGLAEANKGGLAGFRAFLRALANGVRDTLERDLKGLVIGAKQVEAEPP